MANSIKTKDRTNKQICISFGEDEIGLLEKWDEDRRREQITRSSWVKNRIRETLWSAYVPHSFNNRSQLSGEAIYPL